MRPIIEQINLSEQLREIYGSNLVEKVDTINKLSKVGKAIGFMYGIIFG